MIDATDRDDGEALASADLRARLPRELASAGHRPRPYGARCLLRRTGLHGPRAGVTAEATRWLFDQGVRVMGIDAWGWDAPLHLQAERAKAEGKPGVFWEAHQADLPYSQIERLVNLGALPPDGFTVACFPLRLVGGSGAPARVVAILP